MSLDLVTTGQRELAEMSGSPLIGARIAETSSSYYAQCSARERDPKQEEAFS